MNTDDRESFLQQRAQDIRALNADPSVRHLDVELTTMTDRYNFSYMWDWLGIPIIQMPTDIVVMQELIWERRPDVVIETGIARGGSLVLYASVLQLLGQGKVVGVDIDLRPHNRDAIVTHPLAHRIHIVDGSSTDESTVLAVKQHIARGSRVMVVLDSNHTHDHVERELACYSPLVTPGQPLVVADTVVEEIPEQHHRPRPWGPGNNPKTAVERFLEENDRFELDPSVNGKLVLSSSRGGYLLRVR